MRARTLCLLLVLGAPTVPACDAEVPAAPATARRAADGDPAAAARPAGPPRRGRLIAGEKVARVPRWPAPDQVAADVRDRMPAAARAGIERSPVPVLAPADPELAAAAAVFSQDAGYALSTRRGPVSLAIQASRLATLLPDVGHVPGDTPMRGVDGWLTANDGVRSAAWIEHGVAYSLDLECFQQGSDACSEAAALAAVEDLVYVGGAGATDPAGQGGAP